MKKVLICLIVLTMSFAFLYGQSVQISGSPRVNEFNQFNMAQIDPERPLAQPPVFDWAITTTPATGETQLPFGLNVKFFWDRVSVPLLDYDLITRDFVWDMRNISVTNRDILSSVDTQYFTQTGSGISLDALFDVAPELEDVVLNTGLLPDGTYTFTLTAYDLTGENDEIGDTELGSNTMTFIVTNSNSIFLNQPGAKLGGFIPILNNNTVVFGWQTNLAGINDFKITIREYELRDDLVGHELDYSGRLFTEIEGLMSNVHVQFLPFNDGYYYAWKVSTGMITESSTSGDAVTLESDYNVFRFEEDTSSETNQLSDKIIELLRSINNPEINALLDEGMVPTQQVVTEENWLSGEDAIKKLTEFIAKPVNVEIKE